MSITFADLGVPEDLVSVLSERNITHPFPIQAATLADALAGKDLCGRAPTGSGKTLAFAIPLVNAIQRARPKQPRALVLVPTRELAAQVEKVVAPLAAARELRVLSVYGGVAFEPQLKAIRRGVDIVVACPGRLIDLLNRNALSLQGVDFVVVDEADRMADMGFLPDVRRLLDQTSAHRQTLLFSATLDGDVDFLVQRYQNQPVRHEVVSDDDDDNTLHMFWRSPRQGRVQLCSQVVQHTGSTVIFTRTKHGADRLAVQLQREGLKVAAIHGGRTQGQRDKALAAFATKRVHALVATDVAARGIHVDDVACVIHYDVPDDYKSYVHRSGRTARAGAAGIVVSLVEPDQISSVTQMQRKLAMAAGVIEPDFRAFPEAEPFEIDERPGEFNTSAYQNEPSRPTRSNGPRRRHPQNADRSSSSGQAAPARRSRRRGRPAA